MTTQQKEQVKYKAEALFPFESTMEYSCPEYDAGQKRQRDNFMNGATFLESIANPWIKIEEGGFPDRDSTLWCWSKEWGEPDFLRLVWIIENGQRVWWLYKIDEYEKNNPVPLIVDEDIFPTHYFMPPLPPTE